jgi:hypothetical protein
VSGKASLPAAERQRLLDEVRDHLPAFLSREATEQRDPAGDVRELLNLKAGDLSRVVAVHQCLDEAVLAFGTALRDGLNHPIAGSVRPTETSQSVCGPIDWPATTRRRALAPGAVASFVVRPPRKVFDTAENRAVVWLLVQLESRVDEATTWKSKRDAENGSSDLTWSQRLERLREQLAQARRTPWLGEIGPERPTDRVLRRLRAARTGFYAEHVAPAIASVLNLTDPSPETLTDVLAQRYFRPDKDETLFEVAVALRLARAFGERSPHRRRTRLLLGEGRSSFARYSFANEVEVTLAYQAWPDGEPTMRRQLGEQHGLRIGTARPDILVKRTGPDPDAAILELKASRRSATLRGGLAELLAYVADRPDLWGANPSAWLVAPVSDEFRDEPPGHGFPLWIVSADQVAAAAVDRFVGDASTPAG